MMSIYSPTENNSQSIVPSILANNVNVPRILSLNIGNDLFLQAVPPPSDASTLPWKIVVGGPVPGNTPSPLSYESQSYIRSNIPFLEMNLPHMTYQSLK